MSQYIKSIHRALNILVKEELPYISGTFSLSPQETKLFYSSASDSNICSLVDFTTQADDDVALKALSDACEPASFGIGGKDVLDESYRKAGKMDPEIFSSQFTPLNHGVTRLIHENLFKGVSARGVRVELYKLNVYGPGSFFKAHVDTPRGDDMFGSLVVVLPTKHEGGSLILRHNNKEWTFDSAKTVEPTDPTSLKAGFAIFYSDVEHEVTPVISGYRVTLTYNLYFGELAPEKPCIVEKSTSIEVQHHLKALLDDDKFLPEGGHLGFKLLHKYPISTNVKFSDTDIKSSLKGPDRHILLALEGLGVHTSLRIFYQIGEDNAGNDTHYMLEAPLDESFDQAEDYDYSQTQFARDSGGKLVMHLSLVDCYTSIIAFIPNQCGRDVDMDDHDDSYESTGPPLPIYWVNSRTESATRVSSAYLAYGNESSIGHFYGELSIVATIGPKGHRQGRPVA